MNKQEIIERLRNYKERLRGEVLEAFHTRGREFGNERFDTWRRKLSQLLDAELPGETSTLNLKLQRWSAVIIRGESDAQRFWREDGEKMEAYIDSLILDIENDEYDLKDKTEVVEQHSVESSGKPKDKVFIVHGHDNKVKERTARFIEKLGFEAIILHEKASKGKTIIEKIEEYSNKVGFGIVLYTSDDMGNVKSEVEKGNFKYRARQNVVFEHGYLIGKIGRHNVVPLVDGDIELPNDISGVVYVSDKDWQVNIAKEMKASGYEIDFNKIL